MENKDLFTDKVTKGNRTYLYAVKQSEKGDLYLTVTESKKTEKGFEKYRIFIFEEDLKDVQKVFNRAARKLAQLSALPGEKETSPYDDIRETYPKAYMPWGVDDDKELELLFAEGRTLAELSAVFGRQEGAIRSRIGKLKLKEKES